MTRYITAPWNLCAEHHKYSTGLIEMIDFVANEGPGTACLLFVTVEQAATSLRFNGFTALGIAM
jgi:hypothetical protein